MKDEIRTNANLLIDRLTYRGIKDVSILTGDVYEKVYDTAQMLGIRNVYAQCSSEDKLSIITEAGKNSTVMMVGDGINDMGTPYKVRQLCFSMDTYTILKLDFYHVYISLT